MFEQIKNSVYVIVNRILFDFSDSFSLQDGKKISLFGSYVGLKQSSKSASVILTKKYERRLKIRRANFKNAELFDWPKSSWGRKHIRAKIWSKMCAWWPTLARAVISQVNPFSFRLYFLISTIIRLFQCEKESFSLHFRKAWIFWPSKTFCLSNFYENLTLISFNLDLFFGLL